MRSPRSVTSVNEQRSVKGRHSLVAVKVLLRDDEGALENAPLPEPLALTNGKLEGAYPPLHPQPFFPLRRCSMLICRSCASTGPGVP